MQLSVCVGGGGGGEGGTATTQNGLKYFSIWPCIKKIKIYFTAPPFFCLT